MFRYIQYCFSNIANARATVRIVLGGLSFFIATLSVTISQAQDIKNYTLRIELTPAVCFLQPQRNVLRQCKEGFSLSVSGLRPEPISANSPCSSEEASLPPLQEKIVSRIMPDKLIRDLVWQRYGACTNLPLPSYFRLITTLSGQLNIPAELSTGAHYMVNKLRFEQQMMQKNPGLDQDEMNLFCQKEPQNQSAILTELQVCYDDDGKFDRCVHQVAQTCPQSFVIRGLP